MLVIPENYQAFLQSYLQVKNSGFTLFFSCFNIKSEKKRKKLKGYLRTVTIINPKTIAKTKIS